MYVLRKRVFTDLFIYVDTKHMQMQNFLKPAFIKIFKYMKQQIELCDKMKKLRIEINAEYVMF